jgi:hypothetical protein
MMRPNATFARTTLPGILAAIALTASLAFTAPAAAQETVRWSHKACPTDAPASADCNPVRQITVSDGEMIHVLIENTCPERFEYTIVRIPREDVGTTHGADVENCTETKRLEITHDDQYGGYVVNITKTSGNPNVGSARLTISAKTSEWNVAFSGGFNATGLTNHAFALRDTVISTTTNGQTTTETKYRIVEEDDQADEVGRSVASFVHLQHTAFPHVGLTFGVGVDSEQSGEYYFGPSIHFGERGSLNFGAVIGNVERLPTGRRLDDLVTDANLLSTLGDRTVVRGFVGLSFRFLNGTAGDNLKKPFLGRTPVEDVDVGGGGNQGGSGEEVREAEGIIVEGDGQRVAVGQAATVTLTVVDGEEKGVAGYLVTHETATNLETKVKVTMAPDALTTSDGKVVLTVTVLEAGTYTLRLKASMNTDETKYVEKSVTVTGTAP